MNDGLINEIRADLEEVQNIATQVSDIIQSNKPVKELLDTITALTELAYNIRYKLSAKHYHTVEEMRKLSRNNMDLRYIEAWVNRTKEALSIIEKLSSDIDCLETVLTFFTPSTPGFDNGIPPSPMYKQIEDMKRLMKR